MLTILGGTAAGAALLAARARWQARVVERVAEGVARVRVPAHFTGWAPVSTWLGTSLRFTRDDPYFWHIGSSTPYRANLAVIQVAPRQMQRLGDDVLRHIVGALMHVEDAAWEARDGWKLRVGGGRYTPNLMKVPSWLALAIDPGRALVVSYRVWKASASRAAVEALVETIMRSYQPALDPAEYFEALPRDITPGIRLALPAELWDPYPWVYDRSGLCWLYFRTDRHWADDPELPEQAIAVATFFRPGDAAHAAIARQLLAREAGQGLVAAPHAIAPDADAPVVAEVTHQVGERREPSWLVTRIDAARGVGLAYRAWRRDRDRDAAVRVVERALASYRFTGPPTFFDPPPLDAP
ncbi:MAG TPA: hypothetical protein VFX50_03710 [Gemmatimonadales bacterium]|nr:hypothetical protein [Gemmatimonadales bacterium]